VATSLFRLVGWHPSETFSTRPVNDWLPGVTALLLADALASDSVRPTIITTAAAIHLFISFRFIVIPPLEFKNEL
jgi:hypothetical protein